MCRMVLLRQNINQYHYNRKNVSTYICHVCYMCIIIRVENCSVGLLYKDDNSNQ